MPSITLVRIDELHLIARIEFAGPKASIGDEAAIAPFGALHALDQRLAIDDLQGLPASLWFFLGRTQQ